MKICLTKLSYPIKQWSANKEFSQPVIAYSKLTIKALIRTRCEICSKLRIILNALLKQNKTKQNKKQKTNKKIKSLCHILSFK